MSKISPEEHAKRIEAVRYARGTMGLVEGYTPSALAMDQERRFIAGEITIDEAIAETLQHYRLPDMPEPKED